VQAPVSLLRLRWKPSLSGKTIKHLSDIKSFLLEKNLGPIFAVRPIEIGQF
jgi:hypothetical protein